MMPKLKKPLIILFIIANIYAILSGGLYFFQENLIFHPQQLSQDYDFEFRVPFDEVYLDTEDGAILHGIHFKPEVSKGTLLYYHGNAGSLLRWGEIVHYFVEKGYDVIVMDYRQFGKSTGALSESALYEDSLLWYTYAERVAKKKKSSFIVYGRSLGTTFATYVSSKNTVDHLILETPFWSIQDEAKSRFSFLPIQKLLKYKFPTYSFINDVKAPITIFHGTEDNVVAYEHGEKLFKSIKTEEKELITVPAGGHNNLIEFAAYRGKIDQLLE